MTTTAAPPATDLAAQVQGLSFAYAMPDGEQRLALDGLTLDVPSGAVFGLLGPNGSGKSTLLSLLVGLRQPSAGEVRVLGQPPSAAIRARIGLLFQETSLDPLMTLRETLWLHGRLYGLAGHTLRTTIAQPLESVGLADRADSLVSTLSGGMKRRLELARALSSLGAMLRLRGGHLEAETAYRQALSLLEELTADDPNVTEYTRQMARSQNWFGQLLWYGMRHQEALEPG
ncbi:MAG: ATP-binding cassette domain-containing protein [Chloroflexi bacterium]|nr:ATP-binding cassette domain-containing protein [Chloroflexota bacterium]